MWTAPTCRSFPAGRHVGQWESGDMSRAVLRMEHAFKGHSDCRLDAGAGREDVRRMLDQLLPQPPPDAPAPGPSEEALKSRSKFWWMSGIGLGSIMILLLLPLFLPRQRGPHDLSEAVSNARQVGLALYEFETEYGKFPDSSTVTAVRRNTGSTLTLPDHTSNDPFAQLIVLRIDNSVSNYPINSSGKIIVNGLDFLDPRQPYWSGKAPDVKWPK